MVGSLGTSSGGRVTAVGCVGCLALMDEICGGSMFGVELTVEEKGWAGDGAVAAVVVGGRKDCLK